MQIPWIGLKQQKEAGLSKTCSVKNPGHCLEPDKSGIWDQTRNEQKSGISAPDK